MKGWRLTRTPPFPSDMAVGVCPGGSTAAQSRWPSPVTALTRLLPSPLPFHSREYRSGPPSVGLAWRIPKGVYPGVVGRDQRTVPAGSDEPLKMVTWVWAVTLPTVPVRVTCPAAFAVRVGELAVSMEAREVLLRVQVASERGRPL